MNEINKKYILRMEVISPLHVGAGAEKDWMQGSDFVLKDGKVKILNLKKVAEYINVDDLSTALINKDSTVLVKKLGANFESCVDKEFDCNYVGSNDIKTIIKNGLTNQPIVPGSSLKGAIRSVLVEYFLNGSKTLKEQELFGKAADGDEFMRFIKVSDTEFETTKLINTKIFNLRSTTEGGWKHGGSNTTATFNSSGFNTFYEVIEPESNSILSISIAKKSFLNYSEKIRAFSPEKKHIINNEISFLFDIINKHTKKYLEKEKAFFNKYVTDKTEKIIENINSLINQIPQNGEYCILKMAAGSGFHSITGDWQFDDYSVDKLSYTEESWGKIKTTSRGMLKNQKSAKSRKIAVLDNDQFCLMGFVKIIPIKNDELLQIEAEKKLRLEKLEEKRKAEEKIAAEQKKKKEEEQKRLEQQQKRYDELIDEANQYYGKIQLEEAVIVFRKAADLMPDETKHIEPLIEIEKELARIQQEMQDELAAQQAAADAQKRREEQIESGLSFLEEKFDDGRFKVSDFKGAKNRIDAWLKKANKDALPTEEHSILIASLDRIYKSIAKEKDQREWNEFEKGVWISVIKWVGKENAKAFYSKLIQS